jgi:hypothetical protein
MKNRRLEIRWGIYFIAMQLSWMLLEKLFGFHDAKIEQHATVSMLVLIPSFLLYFLALRQKRLKDFGGKMSFKQGFVAGLIITATVTVLTPLSQAITSLVITPDYFANMIAYAVETGTMSQEAAEAEFKLSNYIFLSTAFAPVAGIVTSLIMAALNMRK